ncbi:MAG TPA: flagellar hook-length control protein FliK [Candidatus Limnocylindria bacterium]|nr:flagellar hook-length control protein FliK [Candidatus Limnocylindria bacterium]
MGAFAHLIALLKDGGGASSTEELPPLADGAKKWIETDSGPDALWASVWFPTASPPPTPLPLPHDPALASGSVAALHANVGETPAATHGAALLTPALFADGQAPANPLSPDGTTPTPVFDVNGPRPDALPPTASDVAVAIVATAPGSQAAPRAEVVVPTTPSPVDITRPDAPVRLAEQVVWAIGEKISEVQLELHPQELGAIDVRLRLEGDKVRVEFASGDAAVRDVVQTSLPSLSSLLSARGLQLDHAQVFAPKSPAATVFASQTAQGSSASTIVNAGPAPLIRRMRRAGLLDDYV